MNGPRGDDRDVLDQVSEWQARGLSVTLVSVVATQGGAPHELGSLSAITACGRATGTIAGTCLGEWLAARLLPSAPSGVWTLVAGPDTELDLPCGARIVLLVENPIASAHIARWRHLLSVGSYVGRTVDVDTGDCRLSPVLTWQEPTWTEGRWQAVYGPAWRVLLLGAGAVALALARLAQTLGFQVTLCEPRAPLRAAIPADLVSCVTALMPDDAVLALRPDARTAVIALAHDPRIDDLGLWEAVTTEAFYIAALGSAASHRQRLDRLATLGVDPEARARIEGPAGLAIGSRTPSEIAVAVAGGLVMRRRAARDAARHSPLTPDEALYS